jgi:DNA-binding transcriptional ArsR family regulator
MPKSRENAADFRRVLKLTSLLGHPLRVVIVQRLARSPGAAGELAQKLPVTRTAVVQHLKLLEEAGIVKALIDGKRRVYHVNPRGLDALVEWINRQSGSATVNPLARKPAR